jgi:hypothetical protein
MLRNSDIIHNGLKDIYATGTTQRPAPPADLVRPCDRRLGALARARIMPSKGSLFGIVVIPLSGVPTTNNPAFEMPVNRNKITFQWNSSFAQQVDWL